MKIKVEITSDDDWLFPYWVQVYPPNYPYCDQSSRSTMKHTRRGAVRWANRQAKKLARDICNGRAQPIKYEVELPDCDEVVAS